MTSHTTSQESGWYSVKEACQILDISRRTLYDRIEFKKIDTKKEGKRRLVCMVTSATTDNLTHTRITSEIIRTISKIIRLDDWIILQCNLNELGSNGC